MIKQKEKKDFYVVVTLLKKDTDIRDIDKKRYWENIFVQVI